MQLVAIQLDHTVDTSGSRFSRSIHSIEYSRSLQPINSACFVDLHKREAEKTIPSLKQRRMCLSVVADAAMVNRLTALPGMHCRCVRNLKVLQFNATQMMQFDVAVQYCSSMLQFCAAVQYLSSACCSHNKPLKAPAWWFVTNRYRKPIKFNYPNLKRGRSTSEWKLSDQRFPRALSEVALALGGRQAIGCFRN